jgi:hypothetical protein
LGFGVFGGLGSGLGISLVGYSKEIKPVEKLRWSWSTARFKLIKRLFSGLLLGLFFSLGIGLFFEPDALLHEGLSLVLLRLGLGLLLGLSGRFTTGEIGTQSFPNEGIRRSAITALICGLVSGLVIGLVFGPVYGLVSGIRHSIVNFSGDLGLFFALLCGLCGGLRFGGRACLYHCAIRLVLWHKNFAL